MGCPIELYVSGTGFAPNATYTATGTFSGTEIAPGSDPETIATVSNQAFTPQTVTADSTRAFGPDATPVGDVNPYLLLPITDTGGFAAYNDTITISNDGMTDVVSNVLTHLDYGPV